MKKVVQYVQKELKTLPSEFAAWEHGTRSTNFDAESPNDRVEQVPPAIEIRSLAPVDDATAFRTLNEEWITQYFTLEPKDRETLNDPVNSILLKGGHIFVAYAAAEAVGCVALIPMRDGVYELSKLAVSPHLRGRGLGRRLHQHALEQAKRLGAKSLLDRDSLHPNMMAVVKKNELGPRAHACPWRRHPLFLRRFAGRTCRPPEVRTALRATEIPASGFARSDKAERSTWAP